MPLDLFAPHIELLPRIVTQQVALGAPSDEVLYDADTGQLFLSEDDGDYLGCDPAAFGEPPADALRDDSTDELLLFEDGDYLSGDP